MKQSGITIGLRMKLFAAFALVALAPLLFLAVVNDRNIRQALIQNANQSLFQVATATADRLDELIDNAFAELAFESRLPVVQAYLARPPESRRASQEELRLLAYLTALRGKEMFIRSYGVLDLSGDNLLDSYTPYRGQSEAGQDYFRHFQSTTDNAPFVSAVQYRPDTETALLYFMIPILNDRGQRIGYLRAEYEAAVLQSLIVTRNDVAGTGSFGVLFDEYNIHLAHGAAPEMNHLPVVRLAPEVEAVLQAERRLPDLANNAFYPLQLEALAAGLNNAAERPFFEAMDAASGKISNQVAVAALNTQPWVVAFFQPQAVFLAPVEAQKRQTAALVAIIAGTAVFVAYLFGGILVRPVQSLSQTLNRFADGDLLARSDIIVRDEIGVLAAHFNEMAERVGALLTGLTSRTEALEQEVAERKRAEEALRRQRRFLYQVINMNPSFIFAKDRDGRFAIVNQAFAAVYRTNIENMVGKTDADFNPDAMQVEQFRRDDSHVFQSGEDLYIPEQRSRSAAGEERWWQTIKRPIRTEEGAITEVLTVVTEITERKQTEEALRIARDRALEAGRVKSEILSKAHHELQTPLGAILGYAEMMEMGYFGDLNGTQKETLQKIINRTNHLTALIQDLLAQANLDARKISSHQTAVAPQQLLAEMHQAMDEEAAVKGLALTSEIADAFPSLLLGDASRLLKILSNLVGNGIKFTQQGTVHTRLYQPDETTWAIEVSDTGPGISAEAQAYIFEPFRQVDGSITRVHQGFGLGLSLVKELTLSMEGEIHLTSEPGNGSTFTVILPYMPVMEAVT